MPYTCKKIGNYFINELKATYESFFMNQYQVEFLTFMVISRKLYLRRNQDDQETNNSLWEVDIDNNAYLWIQRIYENVIWLQCHINLCLENISTKNIQ